MNIGVKWRRFISEKILLLLPFNPIGLAALPLPGSQLGFDSLPVRAALTREGERFPAKVQFSGVVSIHRFNGRKTTPANPPHRPAWLPAARLPKPAGGTDHF